MSDPHVVSEPSPLDLYRENQSLAAKLAAADARCAELEAQKNAALQRAWSAEASLSVRVGMRREFEEILGVSDTMEPGAFEVGVARLHRLIAAEARCESVTKWAAEYHAKWQAAEARCAELEEELRLTLIASHVHADEHRQQRDRAARYEEALREIEQHPCWLIKIGWGGTCVDMKAAGPCASCRARAALAGGE
jgi:hypothetical protein